MTLYDIDRQIESLLEASVDMETGEIKPEAFEDLEALQMARDAKIENIALWHKNLLSDTKALADEIKALQDRKKRLERKLDWLDGYLEQSLQGQKFETSKVAISFRKSQAVHIADAEAFIRGYKDNPELVETDYSIKKANIKKMLKEGQEILGAELVENKNMQIK